MSNKKTKEILSIIRESHPEVIIFDGFDDCIIGICNRYNQEPIIAYAYDKVIKKLMVDGMSLIEAEEYYEFNIIGSGLGERTPCFIDIL